MNRLGEEAAVTFGLLLLALPALACAGGESPATPKSATLGREFTLKPGEVAILEAERLEVGFDSVTSDSRCPVDVTCVWEGEAALSAWTRHPSDRKAVHELKTRGAAREVAYLGFLLRLTSLAPEPRNGQRIDPKDYAATFLVVRK